MSDGSLSQDEIDALLQGADDLTSPSGAPAPASITAAPSGGGGLSDTELNVLADIFSQQFNAAASTLSTITSKNVSIASPVITVKSPDEIRSDIIEPYTQIKLDYIEGLSGDNAFLLKQTDASIIADLMMGHDGTSPPEEMNDLYVSAISEAVSQMNGSAITALSNKLNKQIKPSSPKVINAVSADEINLPTGDKIVRVTGKLDVEGLIDSDYTQLLSLNVVKDMVGQSAGDVMSGASFVAPQADQAAVSMQAGAGQQMAASFGSAQPQIGVQPVQYPVLSGGAQYEQDSNINLLMDVPMQITVELGRTRMLIKEILSLGEGSIIELDKLAGEPVDLLVNNKLIAKGEVVVIDENFGVRVTDIISPIERVDNLKIK